jgi:hypothetical protein
MSFFRRLFNLRVEDRKRREHFPLSPVTRAKPPDTALVVVAMVRDGAPYLDEWIEFHTLVGAGHFLIYDNGSADGTQDILARHARSGCVTWFPWPDFDAWNSQFAACAHATALWRERCRWMAFIDLDEFVFPARAATLPEVLATFGEAAAVVMPWRNFGYGGQRTRPSGLVIETFRFRMAGLPPDAGRLERKHLLQYKTIADPCRISRMHIHVPAVAGETVAAGEAILLNHYFTRSEEEFEAKLRRGYGSKRAWQRRELQWRSQFIRDAIERDPVEDLAIQRFVPALKERLASRHAAGG